MKRFEGGVKGSKDKQKIISNHINSESAWKPASQGKAAFFFMLGNLHKGFFIIIKEEYTPYILFHY